MRGEVEKRRVGRARDSGRARKRSREDIGGLEWGRLARGVKFISSGSHVVCYIFAAQFKFNAAWPSGYIRR